MGQRVEYRAFPGIRYDQYMFKLQQILDVVRDLDGRKFKTFRDRVRKLGVWDKDNAPILLSLVDIAWDRREVKVGALAKALMKVAGDEQAMKDLVYERLATDNILLVKYVLEALDVEGGGRLHSVHELYRMITSYVYPGEYVTLENFKAWVDWLAATGYIRMVGIRWALGEGGLRELVELKSMDIEEILEDMEDDAMRGDIDEDEDDAAAVGDPEPAPSPDAAAAADDDDEDEALPDEFDLPPEAQPPSEAEIAAAEAAFMERFADVPEPGEVATPDAVASAPPAQRGLAAGPGLLHPPIARSAITPQPAVLGTDADARALAARIVGWWEALGDWPTYTAPDLGVTIAEAEAGDGLVVELSVLAVLCEGIAPLPHTFVFVSRLREHGIFTSLHDPAAAQDIVSTLAGHTADEPWMKPFVERLVHAVPIARRVAAKPGVLERLAGCPDGASAVRMISDEVLGGAWVEAPFWVLRELVRLERSGNPAHASAAVVPTARLLANAARIGLLQSATVVSFDDLVRAAEATAALFGADAGYGEALEVMDRALAPVA